MILIGILGILVSVVGYFAGYQRGMEKCMPSVLAFEEMLKIREIGTNVRVKGIIRKYFRKR